MIGAHLPVRPKSSCACLNRQHQALSVEGFRQLFHDTGDIDMLGTNLLAGIAAQACIGGFVLVADAEKIIQYLAIAEAAVGIGGGDYIGDIQLLRTFAQAVFAGGAGCRRGIAQGIQHAVEQ